MTSNQKKMLLEIADGADIGLMAQIARLTSKQVENRCARTVMSLLRAKHLQIAKGGGLEISEAGKQAAAKLRRA